MGCYGSTRIKTPRIDRGIPHRDSHGVGVHQQGAHLAAIQKNGIKLEWHDGKVQTAKVKAVDKAGNVEPAGASGSGVFVNSAARRRRGTRIARSISTCSFPFSVSRHFKMFSNATTVG